MPDLICKGVREKPYLWWPFLLSLAMAIGMWLGVKMFPSLGHIYTRPVTDSLSNRQQLQVLEEAMRYIQARYVDSLSISHLTDETLNAMINQLDPHSAYFPSQEVKHEEMQREGHYEGIGVEFSLLQDTVYVHKIIPGSPAEQVGLKPGDAVLFIDTIAVSGRGKTYQEILKVIPEQPKKEFAITYLTLATRSKVTATIKKDIVHFPSIAFADLVEPGVGLIKLTRFNQSSYREFMEALETLHKRDLRHLVIDLRGNPGGYLQQAVQILSQLFNEKGLMMVYTTGRNGRTEYRSTGRPFFRLEKIAVLIDENSASASEIVAGAVQDLDRGVIVGRRSFGKGLVQKQFTLSDGSAILLTVEKYYTPSGRAIQRDYSDRTNYMYEVHHRFADGELTGQVAAPLADTSHFYTTKGRVVYGGGGITPDLFVPLEAWTSDTLLHQVLSHLDEYALSIHIQSGNTVTMEGLSIYLKTHYNLSLPDNPAVWTQVEKRLDAAWTGLRSGFQHRLSKELEDDPVLKTALGALKN